MDQSQLDAQLCEVMRKLHRSLGHPGKHSLYREAEELVTQGANVNQSLGRKGPLLGIILRLVSTKDKERLLRIFLEHGANPNAPVTGLFIDLPADGLVSFRVHYTHVAQIAAGEIARFNASGMVIPWLVEHGAELNKPSREGLTALDLAMWQLWNWELWFDQQKTPLSKPYYSDEIEAGYYLLVYMPPALELVGTIRNSGGISAAWGKELIDNCQRRMTQVYEACSESREELFARAKAAGVEAEDYFRRTLMESSDPFSFKQMDAGKPTRDLFAKVGISPTNGA